MTISLHNLHPAPGSRRRTKRLGRGNASGRGTTAGKGTKGQRARQGGRKNLRQLGMKFMTQSTPKLGGFTSIYKKPATLPVSVLNKFKNGSTVILTTLVKEKLIPVSAAGAKLVDGGKVNVKLTVKGIMVSEGAAKKITSAGGTIVA
jgi:large subunit ribosomal protein L15